MTQGITGKEPDPRILYADIIDLPHYEPKYHTRMSFYNRAAQFAAFDALAGYTDMVAEEARQTDSQVILEEHDLDVLNQKLSLIADVIEDKHKPEITVRYFIPDQIKAGGQYVEYKGTVKRIDVITRQIIFYAANGRSNGKMIDIDRVIEIHGELVDYMDDAIE